MIPYKINVILTIQELVAEEEQEDNNRYTDQITKEIETLLNNNIVPQIGWTLYTEELDELKIIEISFGHPNMFIFVVGASNE